MGADEIIFFNTTWAFGPDLAIRRSPLDNTVPTPSAKSRTTPDRSISTPAELAWQRHPTPAIARIELPALRR
jgi:hypothetical protein